MSVVKINAIHVPEGAGAELEKRFAARAGTIESTEGFLGFQMLRPVAGESRYFIVTHWVDDAAFQAWMGGQGQAAHSGERAKPVGTGADLLEFEVVLDVEPYDEDAAPWEDLED
ncbi:mycobilin-forming heme oxygenase MhuD [Nocardioides lentus]|uniref:Mycobilin-forming heme oxygenase MhuD n=1 Tax=Nocardioides lentus TaxID=338077 RepID=A0ABN2PLR8_9ACTN